MGIISWIKEKRAYSRLVTYVSEGDADNALSLMDKDWEKSFILRLLDCALSAQNENFSKKIVTGIIAEHKELLSEKECLDTFVNHVLALSDSEFVLSSMEQLLKARFDIAKQYTSYNINLLKGKTPKQQIETINRALQWTENTTLLNAKAKACNDYVKEHPTGDEFIIKECKGLIDKHPDAQVLLSTIAINIAADEHRALADRERCIREAISFGRVHSRRFAASTYNQAVPRMNDVALKVARALFAKESLNRAAALLHYLRDNGLIWYDTYVNLYLSATYSSEREKLDTLRSVADEGRQIGGRGLSDVWNSILPLMATVCQSDSDEEKLAIYTAANEQLSACIPFTGKDSLISSITNIIDDLHFSIGKALERDKQYSAARSHYEQICASGSTVAGRIMLCKLKEGEPLTKQDIEQIKDILSSLDESSPLRPDLALRLCLYLAKEGDAEEALAINEEYLKDGEVEVVCRDLILQRQEATLSTLNGQIAQLTQGTLSAVKAIQMEHGLAQTLRSISGLVVVSRQQQQDMNDAISTYIPHRLFEENEFTKCQRRLKTGTYLSDLINFRNVAIMCLGAAESGQLNDTTYKEFIALWVTAVYQQEIFIKSIEYTSWDDPYTFTLKNAHGVLSADSTLPDNVGDEDENDTNVVSIREVQQTLINRMEKAVEPHPVYQQFFNEQIEAMDRVCETRSQWEWDIPCAVVAPYFLVLSSTYKQEFTESLQTEERGHYDNWEQILHIGKLYGITSGTFGEYIKAENDALAVRNYLEHGGHGQHVLTTARAAAISTFPTLFSSLLSAVMTALNKDITQGIGYQQIGDKYYKICEALNDDNISFVFARYVNQEIVDAYNKKEASLAKCATVLYDVYKIHKGNAQLNNNLRSIVPMLIIEGSQESQQAVDRILRDTHDFDTIANEARFNVQLNDIIDKVNNKTIKDCDALEQLYNLYGTNKDNVRVCTNLAQLVARCVLEYIVGDTVGKQKVCRVLDNLKYNRSTTFKQNNKAIGERYDDIWRQLPVGTKMLLQGFATGYTLTPQGLAVKKGLDYLTALR